MYTVADLVWHMKFLSCRLQMSEPPCLLALQHNVEGSDSNKGRTLRCGPSRRPNQWHPSAHALVLCARAAPSIAKAGLLGLNGFLGLLGALVGAEASTRQRLG